MRASAPTVPAVSVPPPKTGVALGIGLGGIALTVAGFFVSDPRSVALSWLVAVGYWTLIAVGMLILVLIHHIFDASWGIVIRRQFEHGLASFKWLFLLFLPLLAVSAYLRPGLIWLWMNPQSLLPGTHETVGEDILYLKKSGYLNIGFFSLRLVIFFGIWIWLAYVMRRNSFRQDADGDVKWTRSSRFWAGAGIPLAGLAVTFAAIDWFKSLEYHWFSTIYGVYFFATGMRGALAIGVLIMLWLHRRGDYRGILNENHLHSIGQLMLTFTVFWAYIGFSQYFLIWNANVPEETFYFNLREYGDWYWVGMAVLFLYFLFPFCYLLSYRNKIEHGRAKFIAWWILVMLFVDICFNSLPAIKDAAGHPRPFLSPLIFWHFTALAGVGGICIWAYLRSFPTTKLIPIRDPRIVESLTHHEASAS
ncbi:MAG: hypothetical protein WC485_03715 [Opitutaceae bacterium]